MPGELYSDAEQSLKSGGKYMVSASIKAAQFTLKEFDALCRFIARCISGKDRNKIGKQNLKDLMSHGNKVVEIGKEPPKPEEMAGQTTQPDTFSWDKGMIKGFEKYADKYGINYTVLQETTAAGEKSFRVFFEGKDASVVNLCLQNYLKDKVKTQGKKSIAHRLNSYQERIAGRMEVMKNRIKDKVPQHGER
ncbi:MAG: PcfB family protein [Clostridiales bacterium]|nr:PcfB family protein [Clostridiales bacterium]